MLRGLQDLDTSFESTTEGTLSSSTSVNLRLEDEVTSSDVEVSGDLLSLFGGGGDVSALDENTEFPHEVLALILVEVEVPSDLSGEGFGEKRPNDSVEHKIYINILTIAIK